MRLRSLIFLAALAGIVGCAGCGTPGAVQLPSLNLARPVEDLTAARKGNTVRLEWTLPEKNTDRTLVQLKHLGDTLVCRQEGTTLMSTCSEVGSVTPPKGPQRKKNDVQLKLRMNYSDTLPTQLEQNDPAGFAIYAVEIMSDRGRSAGLSNQVVIPLAPTIAPPSDLSAEVNADGVRVSWSGGVSPEPPAGLTFRYRIERRPAGAGGYVALHDVDPAPDGTYLDQTSEWEQKYEYRITSVTDVRAAGRQASVEGDDSTPVEVFTKDIYPPAQPVGLQAVFSSVGQKPFVDLTWAPNIETDVAGYNVFRRTGGGEWQKLNQTPAQVPSFRDESVQPGIKYEYSVSAVDLRGNESPRSAPTTEEVPSKQ
ncbi:MAG: fibronectin type III domain-containing protein [Candidatus Korobacteraceae bacterium]